MLPRWLVIALAILISIAWAVNLTVGLVSPGRSDPYLNGIFALVVGAMFTLGRAALKRRPDDDDADDRGGQQ